jgi:HAD superfamily hydrolase (TIGR01509 family)
MERTGEAGRPEVVVLDVDGTLIDSNDAHARAWVEVGREAGHEIEFARARPLIGMGGDRVLPALTGVEEDDPEGERLTGRRGEIFRERHLPGLRPFPGTRALLERMRRDGYRLVVASSASEEDLGLLLEAAGIADLVEERTSSGDADASKPDPDIVQAALRRAGVAPEAALMLGDTPYDVEACRRAGVPIVALRCGGWDDDALAGAVAVYDDPADLLARYDASPLGRG